MLAENENFTVLQKFNPKKSCRFDSWFKYSRWKWTVFNSLWRRRQFVSLYFGLCLSVSLHHSISLADQQDCMNNTWTVNHLGTLYHSCHLLCLGDTSIFTHIHFFFFQCLVHSLTYHPQSVHFFIQYNHAHTYTKLSSIRAEAGTDKWKPILGFLHLAFQSSIFGPFRWVDPSINTTNQWNTQPEKQ